MTFKQAINLGGCVRKGEKGSLTVYADTITRAEIDAETGEESPQEIHYLKGYTVFNVEQIDGLPEHYYAKAAPRTDTVRRIEHAECSFATIGATVHHGGNRAYYSVSTDHVQMPPIEAFRNAESYYAVRGHETVHWTRHPSRLDRDFGRIAATPV